MVRPKIFAVKRQRTRGKRNCSQIFDLCVLPAHVNPREPPLFLALLCSAAEMCRRRRPLHVSWSRDVLGSAQNVNRPIGEHVSTDFGSDIDPPNGLAIRLQFENALFVPLAEIKIVAVVTKVRTGEIRAGEQFGKSLAGRVTINVAIVVQTLADGEMDRSVCGRPGPYHARGIDLLRNSPFNDVDFVECPEIDVVEWRIADRKSKGL